MPSFAASLHLTRPVHFGSACNLLCYICRSNQISRCLRPSQDRCGKLEQLFLGVSSAGQALEDHCTGLDGEAAQLQDCFDEEHALRLRLQVRGRS